MTERPSYTRVVVKLSGEGLAGPGGVIDPDVVHLIAEDLRAGIAMGKQIAIVVGGGNILRGSRLPGVNRAVADHMGMLATAMNGLALQDALESLGIETRVMSAVPITSFCEHFIRRRCIRHLEKGRIVVLVGGTGNPFFTTDSAAALRANEVGADCLMKATQVDGVFTADPREDPDARRYQSLSYGTVIKDGLKVMDTAAVALCMENDLPILVFNLHQKGNLLRALQGEAVGTMISGSEEKEGILADE